MRLSKHETNDLLFRLEERKYGHRLNSMQLAQKANVSLDDVNRIERQLPLDDPYIIGRISKALGIRADLLPKIAGLEEISTEELHQLDACLIEAARGAPLGPECESAGLQPIYK